MTIKLKYVSLETFVLCLCLMQVSYGKGQSTVVTSDFIKGPLKVRERFIRLGLMVCSVL